jgi:chitodextrinase
VSLAWAAATDNVGVTGYRILRDGVFVTTTSLTGYTDTGLADARTYQYQVVAVDGDGNASAPSGTVGGTTADITAPSAPTGVTVGTVTASSVALSWSPATDNVGVIGYRVLRDGQPLDAGVVTGTSFVDRDPDLAGNTTYTYTVVAFDAAANTSPPSTSVQATTLANVTTPVTLVAAGSSWRYLDNGVDQATAWRNPTFNDTTWKIGNAQFGYGEGDEATVVSYGGDPEKRYVTTYFRKTINVANPAALSNIVLGLLRDDGAVVYLNGVEVARSNMPTGTITFKTQPDINVPTADENTYFPYTIPAALLTTGTNTIAVELHQKGWTNNDLSFDLRLTANQTS